MASLSSKIATTIAKRLATFVQKYDQNWFVRFVNLANKEDALSSIGIKDPMRQHAWVNIAVFFLARNFARADFKIMRGDTEVTTGPVYQLFNSVNPQMSKYQLWEATQAWRKATGEAFWIFDMFQDGRQGLPQTIHIVNPAYMKHRTDKNGEITMWHYEKNEVKIPFLPSELIHFKDWNPWDHYRGANPLIAQDYELAQDFGANQNNLALIRNGNVPGGVLSNKENGAFISKEQALEIKERWMQQHQGPNQTADVAVLGNGLEYQAIQQTIEDMQFFSLKKWNRQTILSRYGVPGALVNITDEKSQLSGHDTQSQMQNVWNFTLIPDIEFIQDKLETDFFKRYKLNDLRIEADLSKIPELAEDQAELSKKEIAEVGSGIITINEARERRGLDPVEWGDTYWVPAGLKPADIAAQPPQPMPSFAPSDDDDKLVSIEAMLHQDPRPLPKGIETSPMHNEAWRLMDWKAVVRFWEKIEGEYTTALRDWFFQQRSHLLRTLSEKDISPETIDAWSDMAYWMEQEAELKHFSKPIFTAAAVAAGDRMIRQFIDLDIVFDADNWNILNTGAVRRIDTRLTKIGGIVDTVRKHVGQVIENSLKDGWTIQQTADALREKYGFARNRAKTIARTEVGGVISDAQIEGFLDVGVTRVNWSSSKDRKVRDSHLMDSEIVNIGESFSNGLMYPREVGAPAAEVVNCRCTLIPIRPEDEE